MNVNKPLAWSYSALTKYETCPKQYYHLRVAKDIKEEEGDAGRWGNFVHEALEKRLLPAKTALPANLSQYEKYCKAIERVPGELTPERQLTLDKNWREVSWFAKTAYVRMKLDVQIINGNKAMVLDWKTGKRKPDFTQLDLNAIGMFMAHPELQVVEAGFVWLKDRTTDKETYRRSQLPKLLGPIMGRVEVMQEAYDKQAFPPRPSGLCKNWCPVPRSMCEFSGKEG